MKHELLKLASNLDLGDEAVGLYDRLVDVFNFTIESEIREYKLSPDEREGTVFVPITFRERMNSYRDAILAHAFRTRGYEPVIVICDKQLDLCRPKSPHRRTRYSALNDHSSLCDLCYYESDAFLESFGLDYHNMSDLVSNSVSLPNLSPNEIRDYSYKEIPVSTFAMSSARKYFKKYTINLQDDLERETVLRFVHSAMQTVEVAEAIFNRYDISATIAHNPHYVDQGPYLAVSNKHSVPAYTHNPAQFENKIGFGRYQNQLPLWTYSDEELVQTVLDRKLSAEESAQITQLMEDWRVGTNAPDIRRPAASQSLEVDDEQRYEQTVCLYTNLLWDAAVEGSTFESPLDWLDTTLEWATDQQSTKVIIKPHPDDENRDSQQPVDEWIRAKFDGEPHNVDVLEPDTDISPYELMSDIDSGVVYTSTIGLEMAYEGIPVIVTGNAHYGGFDFTFDPTDASEYVDHLSRATDLSVTNEMEARAERYAHFFFYRKQIDFPFYPESYPQLPEKELADVITHEKIVPGNENMDLIVERILADEPVVLPSDQPS